MGTCVLTAIASCLSYATTGVSGGEDLLRDCGEYGLLEWDGMGTSWVGEAEMDVIDEKIVFLSFSPRIR